MCHVSTIDRSRSGGKASSGVLALLVSLSALLAAVPSLSVAAGGLDRIKSSGKLTMGYGAGSAPFASKDGAGTPTGYAIDLCRKIADAAKAQLGLPALTVDFVPVKDEDRLQAVAQGKVDILCDATEPTPAARKEVSFSIPVFVNGTSVVVRKDAPQRLKDIMSGLQPANRPNWRASAYQLLGGTTFSFVGGTRGESVTAQRLDALQIVAKSLPAKDYAEGLRNVVDGRADVFVGDRAILLGTATRTDGSHSLEIMDRFFTFQVLAFAVARDDEDLRLLVDSALSQQFRSGQFHDLYAKWFGQPDEREMTFLLLNALPQ